MSGKWEDFIQDGSFGGVTFYFVSASEQHANTLDIREYPARNGQFVESRARKGLRISIKAVFIEENYPDDLWALSDKLDDGTPQEFVHPIHGHMLASCESFTVNHHADDPDSGEIDIVLVEHTQNTSQVFSDRPSVAAQANDTRSNASDATLAAQQYAASTLALLQVAVSNAVALASLAYATAYNLSLTCISAVNACVAVANTLEASGDTLSALAIQAQVNAALTVVDTQCVAVANYTTTEAYALGRALLLTANSLGQLATILISQKPPLTVFTVPFDTTLLAWVHAMYSDSSRVSEVLALNNIPDPLLVPAGTQLRAYAV